MKSLLSVSQKTLLTGLSSVLCVGVIVFIVLGSFFLLPANIVYHVREEYLFSGSGEDTPVALAVMLPKSGPYQSVDHLEISWNGSQQVDEGDFVDLLKLTGVKDAGTDWVGLVEYDVKLPQKKMSWFAPLEEFQRIPQRGIESDSPCIEDKAARLGVGDSGRDAFEIYVFTAEYLTYSRENTDCTGISAVSALEKGECACAGYARVMTALCRASGIPAQMVLGVIYPDPMFKLHSTSFPNNPKEAHAWVEYYAEGSWQMADPTWGAKYFKFMQFNRNDGRHLVYGEWEKILMVNKEMREWAYAQAPILLGGETTFRYFATSGGDQPGFHPTVAIRRIWDGRWVNTLLVWAGMTWLLCKLRGQLVKKAAENGG